MDILRRDNTDNEWMNECNYSCIHGKIYGVHDAISIYKTQ